MEKLKYNKMIVTKEWAKQNPNDAVIAALTTRINKLEGGKPKAKGTNSQPNPRSNQPEESVPGCSTLAKWRTEKRNVPKSPVTEKNGTGALITSLKASTMACTCLMSPMKVTRSGLQRKPNGSSKKGMLQPNLGTKVLSSKVLSLNSSNYQKRFSPLS